MARTFKPGVKWDDEASVAPNARKELPRLAEAYFAEVSRVLAANPAPARLHPLRVAGKRLRYWLELFRPCYGPGLDERLEKLKQVQDLLGQVNDSVAGLAMIRKTVRRSRLRTEVERFAAKRADEKATAFRAYWEQEFAAQGRREWWTEYLAREAHKPDGR